MKRIIAISAMAAMVAAAAMADEPSVALDSVTVGGSATTTWGVDLDAGKTGFRNDVDLTLKVPFINTGSAATEGEGVWAELVVGVGNTAWWTNDPIINLDGADGGTQDFNGAAAKLNDGTIVSVGIDAAKIHIGDLYVGILNGDTWVGEFKVDAAIRADNTDGSATLLDNVGNKKSHGIVVGYGNNNFGFDLDFRSEPSAAGNYYINDYGLAAEARLNDSNDFVPGLYVDAGFTTEIGSDPVIGFSAQAGYKLSLDDTYYVRPVVGYTGSHIGNTLTNTVAGGVIFGWGGKQDANAGVYYLDGDGAKQVTPGVSVVALVPLAENATISIAPSFFSGEIIPGLTAAAYADIEIPTADGADVAFGAAGGVKYALGVSDAVTVIPQFGARYATQNYANLTLAQKHNNPYSGNVIFGANTDNGAVADDGNQANDGLLNIKAGVDVTGLINNTTFGAYYQSRNLLDSRDGAEKAGTINVYAKIAL